MSLPTVKHPTFNINVPGGKPEEFRPMLVREEKILLTAKESGETADVLKAVKQVVAGCATRKGFDVNSLPIFALEYIFLKLRAGSIDSVIKVSYKDNEDEKVRDFSIDLTKIEVQFPEEKVDNRIDLGGGVGVVMRYPQAALYGDKAFMDTRAEDYLFELVLRCIERVYDGEQVYETKNMRRQELAEFVEGLGVKSFEKMADFLSKAPGMRHEIRYTNDKGSERVITMTTLNDFFTLS